MRLLIFLLVTVFLLACSKKHPAKLENTIIQLQTELHSGQDKDDIIEILKTKNIEHRYDQGRRQITAIIRDVKSNFISSKSTQIIVSLDERDTVTTILFKDIYTGP